MPSTLLWFYLAASVVLFLAYAADKSAAISGGWRVRENTLHLLALVGGWPGALVAQRLLRHKTRKRAFQRVFWVVTVLNCSAVAWLLLAPEASTLRAFLGMA